MSVNTIERILWELGDDSDKLQAFLKDPDAYLSRYPLNSEEFQMVRTMDVAAFNRYGVSNMLGLMSWSTVMGNNPVMMFDYLRRMNNGKLPNHFHLPTPVYYIMRVLIRLRNTWAESLKFLGLKKI